MILKKYFLKILSMFFLIMVSCNFDVQNPYTKEEIVFNIPEQEVIDNLHKECQFEKVVFNGVSFDLIKDRAQSAANGKRIDLQVQISNPKINKSELAFAQEFAKKLKPYVKNIDHFNIITIDTKIQTKHIGWSEESNKKTLFYAGSLLEFPIENYFTTNTENN